MPWQSYRVTGLLCETASKQTFLVCMGSPTRISSRHPNVNTCGEHADAFTPEPMAPSASSACWSSNKISLMLQHILAEGHKPRPLSNVWDTDQMKFVSIVSQICSPLWCTGVMLAFASLQWDLAAALRTCYCARSIKSLRCSNTTGQGEDHQPASDMST